MAQVSQCERCRWAVVDERDVRCRNLRVEWKGYDDERSCHGFESGRPEVLMPKKKGGWSKLGAREGRT